MKGFVTKGSWGCLLLLILLPVGRAQAQFTNIDEALAAARSRHVPLFIDFSAVWCHSCHAMDEQVLNGPDWNLRVTRMVLVRSDADSLNGVAWMKKLEVPSLPTYVVLGPDGTERGRLVGEIKRAEFYPALDRLLSGEGALDKLKMRAARGSIDAVIEVLDAYNAREEGADGMKWYAKLPSATRKAVQNDARGATHLHIAGMYADQAALLRTREATGPKPDKRPLAATVEQTRLAESCRLHATQALAGTLTTDERLEVTHSVLSWCTMDLAFAQKKALAQAQLPVIQAIYDEEVPNGGSGLLRDATHLLATLQQSLQEAPVTTVARPHGDRGPAVTAIYRRAVVIGRKALDDGHGGLDVKRDRAMDLVLAEMMHYAGLETDRLAFHKAMVEAYPDDFFCQYEYGRDLLEGGKAADALPFLERASAHADDSLRLRIAYTRAKALVSLNRRPEAEKLFQDALHQEEKMFPDEAKSARQYMKL